MILLSFLFKFKNTLKIMNRKSRITLFFLCHFLYLFVGSCVFSQEVVSVRVLYSANTNGQLLDCGCGPSPRGGLPRRQTIVDSLRRLYPAMLLLDGGDLLATTERQLQNAFVIRAYQSLHYDFINLGDQEFWNGATFLQRKLFGAKLPVGSANVRLANKIKLASSAIKVKNRLRIGLIGIVTPEVFDFFPDTKRRFFHIENPLPVLSRIISDLQKQTNVIFLLAHIASGQERQLATAFPEVAAIFVGHAQPQSGAKLQKIGNTWVIFDGIDGESLGLLTLQIIPQTGKIVHAEYENISLSADIPEKPSMLHLVQPYFDKIKQISRINLSDEKVLKGSLTCYQCHVLEYEKWEKTRHAVAGKILSSLSKDGSRIDSGLKGQKIDLTKVTCSSCHATVNPHDHAQWLPGVQCEACHWISSQHGELGFTDEKARARKTICQRCHTKPYSSNFDLKTYWRRIRH